MAFSDAALDAGGRNRKKELSSLGLSGSHCWRHLPATVPGPNSPAGSRPEAVMQLELWGLMGRSLDRKAVYWFQKHRRGPTLTSWAGMSWDRKYCRLTWSPERSGTGPSRDSCQPLWAGLQFQMWCSVHLPEGEEKRSREKGPPRVAGEGLLGM